MSGDPMRGDQTSGDPTNCDPTGNRSRVGIIGCGIIAPVYARTLSELGCVDLVACADGDHMRAEQFAQKHGAVALSSDDLLADPSIDAVVNLTPAYHHGDVSQQILQAGKSVFSEKPLAMTFAEGQGLVAFAEEQGVRIGCAPDTFLGAGLQAARRAIDRGVIGEPLAANAFMLGFGPEWWHPNPEIFYGHGVGPLFDMGPYYLTALNMLLGPTKSVMASARTGIVERVVHSKGRVGDVVKATVPTHVSSILEYEAGPLATLVTSFDVKASRFRNIEIYGSEATLAVPDPNTFGGPLMVRSLLNEDWREIALPTPTIPQQRGIGLADMLSATRTRRPHRASGDMALHVLEQMTSIIRSSEEGRRIAIDTSIKRPEPLPTGRPANTFD
jgi:predicted dehydrogenase